MTMENREIAIIISSMAFGLIFQIQGLAMGQLRPKIRPEAPVFIVDPLSQ
jgi:hypothetical protein